MEKKKRKEETPEHGESVTAEVNDQKKGQ